MKQHILIIGQGCIGTFLGAALQQNPIHRVVHFLKSKSGKPTDIILNFNDRRTGRTPTSKKILKRSRYVYSQTETLDAVASADVIFVPVRHHQWRMTIASIAHTLHDKQIVVLCGNVLDDFEWFTEHLPIPFVFAFPNFGGATVEGELRGWLTAHFTLGITNLAYTEPLSHIRDLLTQTGFQPRVESDIQGWLMTHFAYNAGMLKAAAQYNGFQTLTTSCSALSTMWRTMKACMNTIQEAGIDVRRFKEGKQVYSPLRLNVLKTYLMFRIPGLAKSADAGKDIIEWLSYSEAIREFAVRHHVSFSEI
jgi:ketopantoate reductase